MSVVQGLIGWIFFLLFIVGLLQKLFSYRQVLWSFIFINVFRVQLILKLFFMFINCLFLAGVMLLMAVVMFILLFSLQGIKLWLRFIVFLVRLKFILEIFVIVVIQWFIILVCGKRRQLLCVIFNLLGVVQVLLVMILLQWLLLMLLLFLFVNMKLVEIVLLGVLLQWQFRWRLVFSLLIEGLFFQVFFFCSWVCLRL